MKLSIFKIFKSLLIGILLIGISLEIRNSKLGISIVNAQIPAPAPIPCNVTGDPEFHSLRPYQASPCTVTPNNFAKFCGNDLTLHDTVTVHYPGSEQYLTTPGCVTVGDKVNCTYTVPVTRPVTIDLSGATLPFMGNTEDVKNSQSSTDSLNAADKMNNYVSWYLNGVENRAENGSSENTPTNVVNFSGPLNKLLPGAILDAQRINSVSDAKVTNHNQIVACGNSNIPILGNILKIGTFTPKECYAGNGSPATGDMVFRLNTWNGDLSFWNSGINKLVNAIADLLPGMKDVINKSLGDHWNLRTPPLPWADENGKPFASEDLYTKAYNEWRGQTCVIIPVINKVVCFENILVPNTYADLYPYIPLSSTEDLKGSLSTDSISSATSPTVGGVTVTGVGFSNQTPSTLFFPHMQESSELASALQDTFVASGEQGNKTASPTNVSTAPICNSVEVRSNKGDKLFATQLSGTLNYTANFSCEFDYPTCLGQACGSCCPGASCNLGIGICQQQLQTCTKDTYISLSTIGSIPKADDVWSQLVAGPEAIFKRIFPKTNTTGSVGKIIDIPGSTNITYSGTNINQESADLKFPHLGGISEYFLKGIQTALRPKGYGEPITFAPSSPAVAPGDVCAIAAKYKIPCCQLEGIMEVETGNGALIGGGSCPGTGADCCTGNFCGPANISCNQYLGLTNGDNLNMCSETGAAELLARAMLLALCQADANTGKIPAGTCNSYDWSTWGSYVLQHYSIPDGNYTAAAYFYGLANGCMVDACSQFRWGAGKGYCDAVKYYCDNETPLVSSPDGSFCEACNATIPAGSPKIDCSLY